MVHSIPIGYCNVMPTQISPPARAINSRTESASTRILRLLPAASLAAAVAWAALAIVLNFVGYAESDDLAYASGASGWLTSAPYLGTSHWAIRHCIVLPMALGFKLFGENEATLVLPSLCYAALLLVLLGNIAARLGGWKAAALTIALAGSVPAVATGASLVSTDLPEAFFIIGSVWAWHCGREGGRPALLLVSGLAAGCAVITRETTVALLLFYLIAFVANGGRGTQNYLIMAAGFVLVVGVDWLYLNAMSGDPLYRLHVVMKGAQGDGPQLEMPGDGVSGVDRFGAIALPRALRPFGALFLKQNFGLLFWVAVPAAVWLVVRGHGEAQRSAATFLGLFGTWVVVSGYTLAPWLWVIPRYYLVCIVLIVPLAVLLSSLLSQKSLWAAAVAALLLGSSLALDLGSTIGIIAGERSLVAAVRAYPGVMHTDPSTARGASWLLAQQGLEKRVSTDLPAAGDLYFFDSRPRRTVPANWPLRSVPTGWVPLETKTHPTKWTGPLVRALGLEALLSPGLRAKVDPVPLTTAVYRVSVATPGN